MLSRGEMRAVHMTAVIRVCDDAGNVIETHEHKAISKNGEVFTRIASRRPLERSSAMRQLSAIGYLVWAFATACYADADSDAVKNADDFLASLKIFELPEGKEAVAKTS
jgi:hypothetical protein